MLTISSTRKWFGGELIDPADLFSAEDDAAEIRPEFLSDVVQGGRFQLRSPRYVDGQLQRSNRPVSIRGLNENHNHELKNLFKGAALVASSKPGLFREFYAALLAKGMRPQMARLTLARKIAAITLLIWKKGAQFDAEFLKPQTA